MEIFDLHADNNCSRKIVFKRVICVDILMQYKSPNDYTCNMVLNVHIIKKNVHLRRLSHFLGAIQHR